MNPLLAFLVRAAARQATPRAATVRSPAFRRSTSPAFGSSGEARLAICRRMSTPCLLRRVARGHWSQTSHAAAVRILMDRDAQGERA